jgi:hypothetical protein
VAPPPSAGTRTGVFGLIVTDAAGPLRFVPSDSVPNVEGQPYGWFIPVGESSRPVKWIETLMLPAPAASWSPNGTLPPGVSVSPDRKTAVVHGEVVPVEGLIFDFWEVAPGDPAGHYTIVVNVENGTEERFSFTLGAPGEKENRAADADREAATRALSQAYARFDWQAATAVSVDMNADGFHDVALLGYAAQSAAVGVVLGGEQVTSRTLLLEFSRGSQYQLGICGETAELIVQPTSSEVIEWLGESPPGYRICDDCVEIVVADDAGCDPLVIYWNHEADTLDWWRL